MTRVVQHLSRFFRQIGDVAGVDADALLGGLQFVEDPDGVGNAALQHVVGVDQQRAVIGIMLCVSGERFVLGVEQLHPGVGHGAQRGDAVFGFADRAGRAGNAADVGCPRAEDGRGCAVGSAGTEFHDRPAFRSPHDAVRLRGDQALVGDQQQRHRLDELRLDRGASDHDDGFVGEHRRALGHRPDVAGEFEMTQVIQEFVAESLLFQERQIVFRELDVLQIVDEGFEACRDDVAAVFGISAVEQVEINDLIAHPFQKIAVCHGQLVKVGEHGEVLLVHRGPPKAFFSDTGRYTIRLLSRPPRACLSR